LYIKAPQGQPFDGSSASPQRAAGQKGKTMETLNSDLKETVPAPASVPAPVASIPEVAAAPAVIVAPAVNAAPAPVATVKGEMPKTTGKTPGGWNRFAGYNPNDAKNKKNDRRGDSSKGRR
jgi:hypothetical protein